MRCREVTWGSRVERAWGRPMLCKSFSGQHLGELRGTSAPSHPAGRNGELWMLARAKGDALADTTGEVFLWILGQGWQTLPVRSHVVNISALAGQETKPRLMYRCFYERENRFTHTFYK